MIYIYDAIIIVAIIAILAVIYFAHAWNKRVDRRQYERRGSVTESQSKGRTSYVSRWPWNDFSAVPPIDSHVDGISSHSTARRAHSAARRAKKM